jgi:hypothetical protein
MAVTQTVMAMLADALNTPQRSARQRDERRKQSGETLEFDKQEV